MQMKAHTPTFGERELHGLERGLLQGVPDQVVVELHEGVAGGQHVDRLRRAVQGRLDLVASGIKEWKYQSVVMNIPVYSYENTSL